MSVALKIPEDEVGTCPNCRKNIVLLDKFNTYQGLGTGSPVHVCPSGAIWTPREIRRANREGVPA